MPKTSLKTLSFALGVGRMGTWEIDLAHHSLTCSAAFKGNFGIPPDQDFTYQQLVHSIHQQDRPHWHSAMDNAIQNSSEFELEYRVFWPDGTLHWNLMHGGPVYVENTQRNLLVGVSLDLTERKHDEMELRLSEERHRALTTATAQIIWVTDANGFGREDQSSWENFTGVRDSGRLDWVHSVHPDDREATTRKWQESIATGKIYEIEHRVRRYDGVYRLMQARGVPVRDADGNIREWIGTHTDISSRRSAENALRDTQARLSLAMQSSGTGMFDWDIANQVITWSPEILQLYGMKEGELGAKYEDWLACVVPEDRERANAAIQSALQTGKYNLEFRFRRHDDREIRWANGRGVVSYDAAGQPARMLGINMDITERKEAEEALAENEELFRLTFENAAVGIAHVGLDGRWLRVNPRMIEITGHTREQLLATSFQSITHPDDLRDDLGYVNRLLAGEIRNYRIEKRYTRRDKSAVWVDLFVSLLRKKDGSPDHFLSIVTDITARKEAEQAIELSRKDLEIAQHLGNLGSWSWNIAADKVIWSKELYRIMGRDPSVPPPAFSEQQCLYTPESAERLTKLVEETIATGISYETELEMVRPDGTTRWTSVRGVAERNFSGKVLSLHGTVLDITDRKRAEDELRKAQVELEQKVRERTWELAGANNSLRELSGRLLQLQDNERRKFARELHDSIGQLVAALSMNVGAIASNSDPANERIQELHKDSQELVQEISKEIRTLSHLLHPPLLDEIGLLSALRWYTDGFTQRSGITTKLETPKELARMSADLEIAIFRVVQECLTNAHRHSGSSSITVRLACIDSELQVEIEDNGTGIPDEKLKEFESSGLSGVGLRGIRERLRQLGGSLEIISAHKGTIIRGKVPFQPVFQLDLSLQA
ncbi:MAG TPA: PAS domain-containing protein [Candidatus Acidoferrum sp.]|jgi:PAS domain S-box-containing protein